MGVRKWYHSIRFENMVADIFKFILLRHTHERRINRFQRLQNILYDTQHIDVTKYCYMCHRNNYFFIRPAACRCSLNVHTVKHFTVKDIYGKSNLPWDSSFESTKIPLERISEGLNACVSICVYSIRTQIILALFYTRGLLNSIQNHANPIHRG